jgi:hypothetical protein
MENWRPVVGFEGYYSVSDQGRVRSADRVIIVNSQKWGAHPRSKRGRMLTPTIQLGYPAVDLCSPQKRVRRMVHSLVAHAFLGPQPPGFFVCHNDGNRSNNVASNLRYDTPAGNMRDREKHGTAVPSGGAHWWSKLTQTDVDAIRSEPNSRHTVSTLAVRFNVSRVQIRNIRAGKCWPIISDAA